MDTENPERFADCDALQPGDRIYRWWDTGALGPDPQPLTVVRVNRVTVTVRTDSGSTFRLPPYEIAGRWTDEPTRPTAPGGQS